MQSNGWLDPKFIVAAVSAIGTIVGMFYAVKIELADHKVRLEQVEKSAEWQWKNADALRDTIYELRRDVAVLQNRSSVAGPR